MNAKISAAVFMATALLSNTPARGADEPLPDRTMIRLGGFSVRDADTLVRLDSSAAPVGLFVDFEDTLGGETDADVVRLDGLYRFDDRHALGYSWYALKFTGRRAIGTEIRWGNETFSVGATVDSEVRFDVFKLSYQYSLFHKDEAELGVLAGLHVMRATAALGAAGTGEVRESVTAPLPVFGVFANYRFSPRWSSYFNYQLFFINYEDKAKGGLQDLMVGLEYRLSRHVALGAALNGFAMDLEARDDAATLHVNTSWSGWMLYGSLYF